MPKSITAVELCTWELNSNRFHLPYTSGISPEACLPSCSKTYSTICEPMEYLCLLRPSPLDILLTQLEYKAAGHRVWTFRKKPFRGTGGWDHPQTLLRIRGTQGPFNAKLMGMLGVGWEMKGGKEEEAQCRRGDGDWMEGQWVCWTWLRLITDAERVGNWGWGWLWWRGWRERGFCGEVSHINVTLRSQLSTDIKRQGNFIPLPSPTHKHRYFIFTWLPFAIISWFSPQDSNL